MVYRHISIMLMYILYTIKQKPCLKITCLYLFIERGSHLKNRDVQIVNYQYISTFTCMALIYVRCATLIAKGMNTIIFWYVDHSERNENCTWKYTITQSQAYTNLSISFALRIREHNVA